MSQLIDRQFYLNILERMPILCVDLVIFHANKYLLVRRKHFPAFGQLWFVGGRVFKNETLYDAAIRKAKEEAGLDIIPRSIIDVVETIFNDGPEKIPVHSVNICYLCHAKSEKVKLDSDHSEFIWKEIGDVPPDLEPKLVEVLRKVFESK